MTTRKIETPDRSDPLYYLKMIEIMRLLRESADAHMAEARRLLKS